jgi:DNA-binding NarL/FixJ family response regulator
MTRILLYSNEPVLAKGLEAVLRQTREFELLPACGALAGVMAQVAQGTPGLLLMDLTREVTFAVLGEIRRAMADLKIVLWVTSLSPELAFQAMDMGIRGILRKTLPVEAQVKCLERVRAGEMWFEKGLLYNLAAPRSIELTRRETQLVSMLSQGLKNKEIATAMWISESAVKTHLTRLFRKVGVKDRFELALFGLKDLNPEGLAGIVEEPPERSGASANFRAALLPVLT